MLDVNALGKLAAALHKTSVTRQRARAGRTVKGPSMAKQLHAAGTPRMTTPGVVAYPRGKTV